jgi:hypothetical protein
MRSATRPLVTTALVAALTLAAAGCGSDATTDTTTNNANATTQAKATTNAKATTKPKPTRTTKKLSARQQAVKFSECMRGQGLSDFPDPNADNDFEYGISVSPDVWKRAVDACKDLEPPGAFSTDRTPDQQAAGLVFARCIRAHGVKDFPDPVDGEPLVNTYKIPSSNAPGGMDILNAAMRACKSQGDAAVKK